MWNYVYIQVWYTDCKLSFSYASVAFKDNYL